MGEGDGRVGGGVGGAGCAGGGRFKPRFTWKNNSKTVKATRRRPLPQAGRGRNTKTKKGGWEWGVRVKGGGRKLKSEVIWLKH